MIFLISVILFLGLSQSNCEEKFLTSSISPKHKYTVEAYRTEPGATVDFSVKVYLIKDKKILIYNAYHEEDAIISWINDDIVLINNKKINITKGETFDWRKGIVK